MRGWMVLALGLVAASPAMAEVMDSAAAGFTVRHEAVIAASPDKVYEALIAPAKWWNKEHSFSGEAANFSIYARPGGCFCEKLPDGGGVRHMIVIFAAPGKMLRMAGGLGPLQAFAVTGTQSWEMKAEGGGTKLTLTYAASGYIKDGMDSWAAPVDRVLGGQFARLKRYIETGSPAE